MVELFLSKLHTPSESASKEKHIDIKLALKAMPNLVDEYNVFRCELINFMGTKSALISFHNSSEDKLFAFFDNRNKSRLNKLSGKAQGVLALSEQLKDMADTMQEKIVAITQRGNINEEHERRLRRHSAAAGLEDPQY